MRSWGCGAKLTARYVRAVVRKVSIWRRRSTPVFCPCCRKEFAKFLPLSYTTNGVCPGCGAYHRHRLLMLYLERETSFFAERHRRVVLHVAPEPCLGDVVAHQEGVVYVRGDRCAPGYTYAVGGPLARIDICSLPFGEATFDIVLCNHVLEHVPDDAAAIEELHRVLRPGGWAVVMVPLSSRSRTYEDASIVDPKAREAAFGQSDHVRWYGRDYPDRLRKIGFTVEASEYVRNFTPEEIRRGCPGDC